MQVVTIFNLMHVLPHSLNTMSEIIFSNSLTFQESAQLKHTLNLKRSKSQNLINAEISRPKTRVFKFLGERTYHSKNEQITILSLPSM